MPGPLRQFQKRHANLSETLLTVKDAIRSEILTCVVVAIERAVRVGRSDLPPPRAILQHACGGLEYVACEVCNVTQTSSPGKADEDVLDEVLCLGLVANAPDKIPMQRGAEPLNLADPE
ncbi:hypothetical protein EV292_11512 [Sphingomonas sp. BK235]|nr:hypothetical protein EV292_11512 [Sphingomonas sp. BK235]